MNALNELAELSASLDENRRLKAEIAGLSDAKEQIADLKQALNASEKQVLTLEAEAVILRSKVEEDNEKLEELAADTDVRDAVDRFLDEVSRPVGTQEFTVPKTPAVNRALIGLYDSISRSM